MLHVDPIEFIDFFDTLQISSVDGKSKPHSSYAPFVSKDKRYYICLSKMAKHTDNLLNSPVASIMFIEDESETKNSFARNRITFDVDVSHIPRDSDQFDEIMNLFYEKFGEKATIYEQLDDFCLFELEPYAGKALFGFGKSYEYRDGKFI